LRRTIRTLTLLLPLLPAGPCLAQTLSARPAIFRDPLLANDPSYGELVLGQTTLAAALRVFAVELQDSVLLPLRHRSNPDTLPTGSNIGGPTTTPKARYRLDVGSGHYTLYFDKNERLIAAQATKDRLPRLLRREDLVARYATLQPRPVGASSESSRGWEEVEAPLAPCVSVVAQVWYGDDGSRGKHVGPDGTVLVFGYQYTCATRPARQRALLDNDP
jgi:hypothetical protein